MRARDKATAAGGRAATIGATARVVTYSNRMLIRRRGTAAATMVSLRSPTVRRPWYINLQSPGQQRSRGASMYPSQVSTQGARGQVLYGLDVYSLRRGGSPGLTSN